MLRSSCRELGEPGLRVAQITDGRGTSKGRQVSWYSPRARLAYVAEYGQKYGTMTVFRSFSSESVCLPLSPIVLLKDLPLWA